MHYCHGGSMEGVSQECYPNRIVGSHPTPSVKRRKGLTLLTRSSRTLHRSGSVNVAEEPYDRFLNEGASGSYPKYWLFLFRHVQDEAGQLLHVRFLRANKLDPKPRAADPPYDSQWNMYGPRIRNPEAQLYRLTYLRTDCGFYRTATFRHVDETPFVDHVGGQYRSTMNGNPISF